jgi:TonB-linked SusC/RagA family outer membrane protein
MNGKYSKLEMMGLWLIMMVFDCGICTAQVAATTPQTKVTKPGLVNVHFKKISLPKALKVIAQKADAGISFKTNDVPNRPVTYQAKGESVYHVLDAVLEGTDLYYTLSDNKKVILIKQKLSEMVVRQNTVSGTVSDAQTGDPLPGVNILVVGTSTGTATDADGHYELEVKSLQDTLRFSYIGYQTQTVAIKGRTKIDAVLESSTQALQQMVVVGFGEQKEGTVTSSISSVNSDQIKSAAASTASPGGLLEGRIAGAHVSSSSGIPGSGIRIKIRGASTISGSSQPLYIIDGIPALTGSFGLANGGETTSAISSLNPNDIESITVLKDASATAIYGANAANGVVIIKTKRGNKDEPMEIQLGANIGFQRPINTYDMVTGSQYEMLMNEAAKNTSQSISYPHPDEAINTDWPDLVFRTGAIQNYNLSIRGGTKKVRYAISGSHFFNKGVLRPTGFTRSTIRIRLNYDLSDKLSIGTNISYSINKRNRRSNNNGGGGIENIAGGSSLLGAALWFPSNLPIYQEDGSYTRCCLDDNPVSDIKEISHMMKTDGIISDVSLQYDFLPGLTGKTVWSYDKTIVNESSYANSKSQDGGPVNGLAESSNLEALSWMGRVTLNYVGDINNKHNFDMLIGGSMRDKQIDRIIAMGQQFPSDDLHHILSAAITNSSTRGKSNGLLSLFGRLEYNYAQRYLVTLNVRRDGSSRFGIDNRWGTFPSVGVGWNINEEPFFNNVNTISKLKIRASYGVTGNQTGINDYASLGLWTGANYANLPGVSPAQLSNPDLKWETTKQLDIGLDLGFFNDRLEVHYDYYRKNTTDLLLAVPVPKTTGFESVLKNFGSINNKGMELSINGDIIKNQYLSWNLIFNISGNRNLITKMGNSFNTGMRDIFRYEEGKPMYSFYLHKQIGVNPETGEILFKDVNGNGKFDLEGDRTIVGKASPDFYGSVSNSVNYRQFSFSILFTYSYGNKQYNMNRFFAEHGGTRSMNFMRTQLNRWQKPGDKTMVPQMVPANYRSSFRPSRFLEDASYVRLKNIRIGYSLPSIVNQKLGISGASIYLSGQNLFTITNYIGLGVNLSQNASNHLTRGVEFLTPPKSKTYMAGINIHF